MVAKQQGVPSSIAPVVDDGRKITQAWLQFFTTLWNRSGGATGAGGSIDPTTLVQAKNDADAAAQGVLLHGWYLNGSFLCNRIR